MTDIDWASLRTSLRTGGWKHHARGLPLRVARHGLGCTAEYGKLTLQFVLRDGEPTALLLQEGKDPRPVATPERVYLRRDEVSLPTSDASRLVATKFPPALLGEVDRKAEAHGWSRSRLIRRACELYIEGRTARRG